MAQDIHVKTFDNGLTLIGQPMDHVSSVSLTIASPAGYHLDPDGLEGAASVASEWWLRGAGQRDTRQLHDALDSLGCLHHEAATGPFLIFRAAQLSRRLEDVMALYHDIILQPRLADEDFASCRDLALQDLKALEDQPAQKVSILLTEQFFPSPFGRHHTGTAPALEAMTADSVRDHVQGHLTTNGAIISIAGQFDWDAFCGLVDRTFGDWPDRPAATMSVGEAPGGFIHVPKDSAQTHIALAQPSVTRDDPRYYAARVAVSVLSGGMSSRLMAEVREKRGLVYHVSTSYNDVKTQAAWTTYAGTVPEKARETLDVTVGEIRGLANGVEADELTRAKTQLKSALFMASDSTASRVASAVNDWHGLGRVRTIDEVAASIDNVTVDDIAAYINDFPATKFVGVVIGPEPLDPPAEA